ncbi:MAG TPA: S9 family peptidase [Oleiagrimonas sp.]|nr:S9 family peptidase [Oleiagrimonas sp.]
MTTTNRTRRACRRSGTVTLGALLATAALAMMLVSMPAMARSADQPSDRFTLARIFDLQWAQDPQISPDGKQIVFVRGSFDIMHDARDATLWIINSDGTGLRPLSDPDVKAGSLRWSPDGTRVLFVTSKDKQAQIRVRWIASGQTASIAKLPAKPRELAWSPDGTRIAFAMFVAGKQRTHIANMPAKPKGADWGKPVEVVDRLNYRFDGRGMLPYGHTHLFVVPATGGTPRQLTFGAVDDRGSLTWSRDGKALIFSANRRAHAAYHPNRSQIYRVALDGGEPQALTDRAGPSRSPAVSPDGSKIAFTGFIDRNKGFHQNAHLYVMDRDGDHVRQVMTDLDRNVSHPQWSADGNGLYFQYVDHGVTRLGYTTLAGKMTVVADILGGGVDRPYSGGSYSLSPATGMFAFTLSAPDHPADVAVGRHTGADSQTTRLTHLNRSLLGHLQLGTLETIHFPSSHDGRRIQGWILKPPGFDPSHKYPLILEIHGGPSTSYGPTFSSDDQIYAANGYVVLYINPRGSTSYGAEFADLINLDYPHHDYDDLMSGVDAVIKRGYIDTDRLYVTGGSGGGVLTAWSVGHTDRFRAAVVVKPVINWYSWVLTADMGYMGMKYWMEGYPWEHTKRYMKRSPISYAGNVSTPTMVMHGEVDYRTPAPSSVQFYRALKMRQVPTVLVRIPGASHHIAAKPSNLVAKIAYKLGWFACYGGPSAGKQVCPYTGKAAP